MKLISDEIIKEIEMSLGLNLFPEKEREDLLNEVLEVLSKQAGTKIIKGFSDEKVEQFNQIPKENLEEMETFMIENDTRAVVIFKEEAALIIKRLLNSKVQVEKDEKQ
jgi:hypothetical protein